MATRELPSPELLRKLLNYDPETGLFVWRERPPHLFDKPGREKQWNACWAGKPALNTIQSWGYLAGRLQGRRLAAHRAAWAMHYGKWPENEIDHINGDKTDNRICNLRDVPRAENAKNLPIRFDNSTGVTGVKRAKTEERWEARICHEGKYYHLGVFQTFGQAAAARHGAEVVLGFHPNHGRPAMSQARADLLKNPALMEVSE